MKKFRLLLLSMAVSMAYGCYAQTNTDWTLSATERLANGFPYLSDYLSAPTNGLVYAQEFSFANSEDVENNNYHILTEDQTHKLDRTMNNGVFSHFVLVVNNDNSIPVAERPEMDLEFKSLLTSAYKDTVFFADYTEFLQNNVNATVFLGNIVVSSTADLAPMPKVGRGGEYYTSIQNNIGTSHETHLTLTADPCCSLDISNDLDWGFMMSSMANIKVFIASGYPYADRLSDYQSGEVKLSVLDANDVEAYTASFPLEASADSLLLEYVIDTKSEMFVTSPKYTFKLSGPMLAEDIVITREALPNLLALNEAILEAETLSESILNDPDLVDLVELATQLKDAAEGSKQYLNLTAYEQDMIDSAANSLKENIDYVRQKMQEHTGDNPTAIETVNSAVNQTTDKRMFDGQMLIFHKGVTYDARGVVYTNK